MGGGRYLGIPLPPVRPGRGVGTFTRGVGTLGYPPPPQTWWGEIPWGTLPLSDLGGRYLGWGVGTLGYLLPHQTWWSRYLGRGGEVAWDTPSPFHRDLAGVPPSPCIGGSRGGAQGRAPPPLGQIFFIFMQFLGKIGQIVCWRPPLWGWRPPVWEILDPPLPC